MAESASGFNAKLGGACCCGNELAQPARATSTQASHSNPIRSRFTLSDTLIRIRVQFSSQTVCGVLSSSIPLRDQLPPVGTRRSADHGYASLHIPGWQVAAPAPAQHGGALAK